MKKIIIGILVICVLFFGLIHYRTHTTRSANNEESAFVVSEGDDIVTIGQRLAQQDLIANRLYFYYYAWKNKLRGKFRSGAYAIGPHSTIAEIVYKLTNAREALIEKEKDIRVTFPEGFTVADMAKRLTENGLPGGEFAALSDEPSDEILSTYSFLSRNMSLEGYLFPDTYFFSPSETAGSIVQKMLANFEKKVDAELRKSIADQGKTLHEIIIFASVIEGEVSLDEDRRIVAGIFSNRLMIGMALQSDATIDYIKGIPEIKHSQEDLEIDSPYNTYKYPGLPPGPINNPSLSSIRAAIDPAETEYMFFLNNASTGKTVFSKTFDEHVRKKSENGL